MTRMVVALLVASATALAGCSGTAVPSPAASTAAQVAATPTPVDIDARLIDARLIDGRVDPFPHRVDIALGTPVVLRIETDTPAEIHVHGYDHSAEAHPGIPARIEFVADVPGVFDVEAHPDTVLFQLAVR